MQYNSTSVTGRWLPILLVTLVFSIAAHAVPAKRGQWRVLTLGNGQTVRAEARGDEAARFWQSADGTCYMLDEASGTFSEVSSDSINTLRRARQKVQTAPAKRRAAATQSSDSSIPGSTGNYLGNKKGLVILVEFSNKSFTVSDPQSFYDRACNEEGFSEEGFKSSVADYFKAQSGGLFELDFDVVGPVQMSQPYSYYGRNDDANAPVMVHDACVAVDSLVNFADYDWDGDGEAEEVFVLYAGYGEADNTDQSSLIWPHMYALSGLTYYARNPLTLDGTLIDVYACSNELNSDDTVNGIGTFCHEFSHCLGFPDLYDTGSYGTAFGMGSWSLFDYGCYNDDGYVPAGYTGYEKLCAGWMTPVELTADTTITDLSAVSEGGQSYILPHPSEENEFLVIDNRQLSGYDEYLPGHGMVVTQVVYDEEAWYYNEVNMAENSYQRCTIYHADNTDGFYDQTGDAYPYGANDSLTANSSPALAFHNALASGSDYMPYGIYDIAEQSDGTIRFTLRVTEDTTTVASSASGVLFSETFDQCSGTGGNDGRFSNNVARGAFNPDMDGWTYTSSAYGGDQCARFGSSTSSVANIVTSPSFTLTGDTATLSFRAACWNSTSDGTSLSVTLSGTDAKFAENGSSEVQLTMACGAWTDYTLTIVGSGSTTIVFLPSRRFFLDEVLVTVPVATGISTVRAASSAPDSSRIYTIDGRYVGDSLDALPHGIYIRGGRKIVR